MDRFDSADEMKKGNFSRQIVKTVNIYIFSMDIFTKPSFKSYAREVNANEGNGCRLHIEIFFLCVAYAPP